MLLQRRKKEKLLRINFFIVVFEALAVRAAGAFLLEKEFFLF